MPRIVSAPGGLVHDETTLPLPSPPLLPLPRRRSPAAAALESGQVRRSPGWRHPLVVP
ncbi:hypothetical protein [Nonomuraea glycinis]|uniref:hypothetical protein n=1 Tax=Nonomuraea glycinis TaxID=2047744 RepID=UPI002E145988|nr:hypothetical protein OHA68_37950 [Nonomuraea glycinis]